MDVSYPPPTPGRAPDTSHQPFTDKPVFIVEFIDGIQVIPYMGKVNQGKKGVKKAKSRPVKEGGK
jgi:hypothetical protein